MLMAGNINIKTSEFKIGLKKLHESALMSGDVFLIYLHTRFHMLTTNGFSYFHQTESLI